MYAVLLVFTSGVTKRILFVGQANGGQIVNRSTRRTFLQQASTVAGTALLGGLTGAARAQSTSELGFMSAVDLATKLRNKEIGSEELARYFISRIERYDEKLNAVVVRDFDRALDAAKEADK